MRQDRSAERAAIIRAAQEDGTDPAYALAVAERESSFDPLARSSKTIRGVYQMRGDLREKYGAGDSSDPYAQAKGWNRSLPDIRNGMGSVLGRAPSDPESYLGHHFGPTRAARMLKMDPSTPVDAVFSAQEMAGNPHFARAGTVGNLNSSVMADIGTRMARFGGQGTTEPQTAEPADLSSLGELVDSPQQTVSAATSRPQAELPDLSSLGTPVEQPQPIQQAASPAPPDLSSLGTPV